jgi:DNA-binding transcriptional LysR family regulator
LDASTVLRRAGLNLLPALAALLEQRHVTRAAESIWIGQPAMSSALARLRRLFGDPLLVRRGRVLELTPMGQALLEPVHDVLASLEHLLTVSPDFDPRTDNRSFTVAASDYVTLVLLRPLSEELYRDAPGLAVNVTQAAETMRHRAEHGTPYVFAGLPSAVRGPRDDVVLPPPAPSTTGSSNSAWSSADTPTGPVAPTHSTPSPAT